MRALRLLLVAAMACGTLLVLGPAASAAVPTASKACNTYTQLQEDIADAGIENSNDFDADAVQQVGKAFRKAAKSAPKNVKSAMNTLATLYEAIGGNENSAEAFAAFAKNGEKISKALTTFSTYYATKCA
jgi:hypothetical protein